MIGLLMKERGEEAATDPSGILTVSWLPLAAPWVSYQVFIDGAARGRFGFRRPLVATIPPGQHSVVVKRRHAVAKPLLVEVQAGKSVDLYSGVRRLPAGMGLRETLRWGREESLWLSDNSVAPIAATPFAVRPVARHRWILLMSSVAFFIALGVLAGLSAQYGKMAGMIVFALIGAWVLVGWRKQRCRGE
jgi:hypothetical protein